MAREAGRIRTDGGDVLELRLRDTGDVELRLGVEEMTGGPTHSVGDLTLRPGQAQRLADLLEEAIGPGGGS